MNQVEVSSDTFDSEDLNNQTSATISVSEESDLGLSLAFLGSRMAGETFQYQYSLTNAGPSEAREVTLLDNLPQEIEFIDAQLNLADGAGNQTVLCTFDAPSALLTCPLGDLPVIEASAPVTVTANLRLKPEASGTKTDDASLSSLTPLAEPVPPTAVDFTVTKQADLSLSESSNPQTAAQGETVKFTLTVTNTGPSDATGVVISDTLPVGIDYDSSHLSTFFSAPTRAGERSKPSLSESLRGAQPVCQLDSTDPDQITCSLGRLIPGEKRAIEIWGIVASDTPPGTILTNTAEVTSPITDPQMDDNRDSCQHFSGWS